MTKKRKKTWGRHFSDAEIADARKNNRLLTMEIETSHICNLRCIYCYNMAGEKLTNELSFDKITNVIEQAIDLGVKRFILIGGGEPLMHPRIMDIIEFIHNRTINIDLFTNGTLLDLDMAQRLYDYGVEPVVKMNSLVPEKQDFLVAREGAFDKIHQGIENLMSVGYPDEEHDMGVETIICSYNYDELPTMWRWARDRNITPYFEMITFQGRAKKRRDLNVSVDDLERMFNILAKIDREEYGYEWEPHPPIAALSCSRHEYSCTLESRGYIQPCTGVNIKVGNVRHNSLKDIIQGNIILHCLRNVRDNIKGACKTCELRHICYGCRGMAYHITGDFLEADPLCWRNPEHIATVPEEDEPDEE